MAPAAERTSTVTKVKLQLQYGISSARGDRKIRGKHCTWPTSNSFLQVIVRNVLDLPRSLQQQDLHFLFPVICWTELTPKSSSKHPFALS